MTKRELAKSIAEDLKINLAVVENVIDSFIFNTKKTIQNGEKIEIRGFATIKGVVNKPRVARNPKTGQKVFVEERRTIKFDLSKSYKTL